VRHPRGPRGDGPGCQASSRACRPVAAGFPHRLVPAPWLVAEVPAAPDRHTGERHVHAGHVYVATTASPRPARKPEHQVRWFTPADIASEPDISEDSRLLAAELLALAAQQPGPRFCWLPGQGRVTAAGSPAVATSDARPSPGGDGSARPQRLIVIRGNSASGKSAVAAGVRDKYGRGLAIVGLTDRWRRLRRSDQGSCVADMCGT
jgi:hypothetical protein